MVYKRLHLLLFISISFFIINISYANVIYDKNNVIISELDLSYYKEMHYEKYNENINNSKALKNLVIIKNVINNLKENNQDFLKGIDKSIYTEIGKENINSDVILDIIRFFRTKDEFVYDYYYNNFNINDLKNVFSTFNNLKLPISENNCLTIVKLVDFKNNTEFSNEFFRNMKNDSKIYEVSINNIEYNVCINQRNKEIIEKQILKYIELKIQGNFDKFIYEKQKK
tara:strand:+ start:4103 stop:4783 length:681 start_codon:yes stop_codon:yes gene_type:complete